MKPTRKWFATLITGLASIAASWLVTGTFDDVERGMAGTLITSLAAAYIVPNVPVRRRKGQAGYVDGGLIVTVLVVLILLVFLLRLL